MDRSTRNTRSPATAPECRGPGRGLVRRRPWLALAPCVLLGLGLPRGAARAEEDAFNIVVHADNPATTVEREFLAEAFLKRVSRWPSGETIFAVDLRFDSPIRAEFSLQVLRRSVAAVRSYWQQRIFAGRGVPPPEVDSDAAAIHYVKKHRGGVGYVSRQADTREVKVLALR